MMNTSALKKTVQNKRLLTKKDFLELSENMYKMLKNKDYHITEILINTHTEALKQMKVNELRELLKITHKITADNEIHYVNNFGFCFSCLKPLKADYTSNFNKNYCLDC